MHYTILEIVWTVIPTIIVFVIFIYGAITFIDLRRIPNDALTIKVMGRQWSWKFTYNNGVSLNTQSRCSKPNYKSKYDCERNQANWFSGDYMIVPLGKKVRLEMSSVDVIHSFYIPAFRVKQDVVPNMTSYLWFEATKLGTYDLFCTEYCGLDHSGMISKVIVKPIPEFIAWLDKTKQEQEQEDSLSLSNEDLIKRGEVLFKEKKGCVACHRLDGQRLVGPPLNGLFGKQEKLTNGDLITVDDNYIRESILEPSAKIVEGDPPYPPMNIQDVTEQEVNALVEFIKSCKKINCGS